MSRLVYIAALITSGITIASAIGAASFVFIPQLWF